MTLMGTSIVSASSVQLVEVLPFVCSSDGFTKLPTSSVNNLTICFHKVYRPKNSGILDIFLSMDIYLFFTKLPGNAASLQSGVRKC